jgi:DNA polymerase III subunit epsilon
MKNLNLALQGSRSANGHCADCRPAALNESQNEHVKHRQRPPARPRFPGLNHPWACSLTEVDWLAHGLDSGRSVTGLLTAAGHFLNHAHRAGSDAWAVPALLAMPGYDGRTIGAHLIDRARKPTYCLYAERAPFALKDSLKAAGYRWCGQRKSWRLAADSERLDNERAWLIALCPAILPRVERIDYFSRHAS